MSPQPDIPKRVEPDSLSRESRSDLSDSWDRLPACLWGQSDRLEAYPTVCFL